jgi:hypothetical protein
VLIPRVFHQIWLGPMPFPDAHARYQETWIGHHAGWEHRMWTEDNIPQDLRRPEARERIRHPAERSDFLRIELLWRYGGVYVDTDFECQRSIEPLIANASFFIGCNRLGHATDSLYGSVARHPILDSALETFVAREFYGAKWLALSQLRKNIDAHRDEVVLYLEPAVFHAKPAERHLAYAVHHEARSWMDAQHQLRKLRSARAKRRRWRARYEEAVEQSNHWRVRYEQVEAELTRLRQSAATDE